MSKVISTDVMGDQLTSRHFARNLIPGDLFVSGTGRVIEVLGTSESLTEGFVTITSKGKGTSHLSHPVTAPYGINQSVDRIIGSRSAGQIS